MTRFIILHYFTSHWFLKGACVGELVVRLWFWNWQRRTEAPYDVTTDGVMTGDFFFLTVFNFQKRVSDQRSSLELDGYRAVNSWTFHLDSTWGPIRHDLDLTIRWNDLFSSSWGSD